MQGVTALFHSIAHYVIGVVVSCVGDDWRAFILASLSFIHGLRLLNDGYTVSTVRVLFMFLLPRAMGNYGGLM